jgi:hypothetical protein
MLRSGELVRCCGSRVASSEAESRSGVRVPRVRRRFVRGDVKPSSEVETRWCGAWSSSEAEVWWRDAWPSSEAEVRPRGTTIGCLVGRYEFLGCGPFSAPGRDHVECASWFVGCLSIFIIFRKGCFPPLLGDPYGCPRQ